MAVKIRDVARVDLLLHVLADRDSQAFHAALTSRIVIRGTPAPASVRRTRRPPTRKKTGQ